MKAAPGSLRPAELASLQRTLGNRAMGAMLLPPVQAKLIVNAGGDRYEREADRVADAVMPAPRMRRAKSDAMGSFEPGADVERLLSANRGGSPLPAKLRAELEPRFGADFANVRVHTGAQSEQLNRSLGAQAFTQGSHIYMGTGRYNPSTRVGKHLLAHELTHVVQQTGGVEAKAEHKSRIGLPDQVEAAISQTVAVNNQAPNGKIQRAVGFEFETGYGIEKKTWMNGWQNLAKLDVIKNYGDGIRLTADVNNAGNSVIEIVLYPPVQEWEQDKFDNALDKFSQIGKAFDDVRKEADIRLNDLKLSDARGSSNYKVTPARGGFFGNPQLTGGIRYDKLFKFLETAIETNNNLDLTQYHDRPGEVAALTGAKTKVGEIDGSAELRSLVAMLGIYLYNGSTKAGGMLNYAKLISNSFMARTDFGAMFNKLPDAERKQFRQDGASFVKLVLDAAGMTGEGDKKVFERGIRKSYDNNSPDYDTDLTMVNRKLGFTRDQWLLGITKGQDRIASRGILFGLGALGKRTDRVGDDPAPAKSAKDKGRGIIVELRNMRRNEYYSDVVSTFRNIFKYLVAFNSKDKDDGHLGEII